MSPKKPVTVLLNLLQLSPGRVEGVATYVRRLVAELPAADSRLSLVLLTQAGLELGPTDHERITVISVNKQGRFGRIKTRVLAKINGKQLNVDQGRVDSVIKTYQPDLIHYPFSILPDDALNISLPIVLSIMDLQHEYLPSLFSDIELNSRRERFGPSAERANKVISISKFTAGSIHDKLNVPSRKIAVVPLAGDVSSSPSRPKGLPADYMYYPAADWPHKNHARLFAAVARLKEDGFTGKVVLTGLRSERPDGINREIERLGLRDEIIDFGPVSYGEVAGIYANAKLLIFPSLFEGFGIPPLEAMSVGIPVVCSNTTSLPEIVGDAALMFDPLSVVEMSAAIKRVWYDNACRNNMVKLGKRRSREYSWKRTARETARAYRQTLTEISTQSQSTKGTE